jgi:hypothetical protein
MDFKALCKKVGFTTAVILRYKNLKNDTGFWDSLKFGEWLDLALDSNQPEEVTKSALAGVKRTAVKFRDFENIICHFSLPADLRDWAMLQMEQRASTFLEKIAVFRGRGSYDFPKLLQLANSVDSLVVFCNIVLSANLPPQETEEHIKSAIEKMAGLENTQCQEWAYAYQRSKSEKVDQFILSKIRGFDLPCEGWLSLNTGGIRPEAVNDIKSEKVIASANSFEDCRRIRGSSLSLSQDNRRKVFERALGFAKTFEELKELAQWNDHKEPLALQIVEKMAQYAKTFDNWNDVRFFTWPNNPLHQTAFDEMKRLVNV